MDGFTKELEEFATKKADYHPVHTEWSIYALNAPERHILNGLANNINLFTILHTLQRIDAFYRLSLLLHLELSLREVQTIATLTEIDVEKEQVWLFAYRWYMKYYEYLSDKATLASSDFYKHKHELFMDLLKRMLEFVPDKRITFAEAMNMWEPKTQDRIEDAAAACAASSLPVASAAAVSAPPTSSVKRRLVLKGWGGPAAHNKTRKNHYS